MSKDNWDLGYLTGIATTIVLGVLLDKPMQDLASSHTTNIRYDKINQDSIPDMIGYDRYNKTPFVILSNSDSTYTLLLPNELTDGFLKTLKDSTPLKKSVFSDIGTIVNK